MEGLKKSADLPFLYCSGYTGVICGLSSGEFEQSSYNLLKAWSFRDE